MEIISTFTEKELWIRSAGAVSLELFASRALQTRLCLYLQLVTQYLVAAVQFS